jgi:hypothetical protein
MNPIYYLEAVVSYKKGKNVHKKDVWIVTKLPDDEILFEDTKTIERLHNEIYGKTYKGDKSVMLYEVTSRKIIGYSTS